MPHKQPINAQKSLSMWSATLMGIEPGLGELQMSFGLFAVKTPGNAHDVTYDTPLKLNCISVTGYSGEE